jgi:hypothetical protein
MIPRHRTILLAALLVCGLSWVVEARIVRLEIVRTEPAFAEQSYGNAGPYQHIIARAYGEVDPADPKNAIIQDLNLAPPTPAEWSNIQPSWRYSSQPI